MIKLIAIAAMTIDHVAWMIFPGYPGDPVPVLLHIAGRITCPVMWSLAWGLVMLRVAGSPKIQKNILAFGTNRGNFKTQMLWMIFYVAIYAAVYFFAIDPLYGCLQMAVLPVLSVTPFCDRMDSIYAINSVCRIMKCPQASISPT